MTDDIAIRFQVTGAGWARVEIDVGDEHLEYVVSYLSDALRDLVVAVTQVLEGSPSAALQHLDEPGKRTWMIFRYGWGPYVDLDISEQRSDTAVTVRLRARKLGVVDLGQAVLRAADAELDRLGLVGYVEQWILHPYPTVAVERLRSVLATGGGGG